jgi:hypothetical protein
MSIVVRNNILARVSLSVNLCLSTSKIRQSDMYKNAPRVEFSIEPSAELCSTLGIIAPLHMFNLRFFSVVKSAPPDTLATQNI